jgi:type I restriction enzyme, S subunit
MAGATETKANLVCLSHLSSSTLPLDWKWVTLGNICRTTSGGTPSRKNKEYFAGDIPWVKSGELPDGPVSEIEEYITEEAVKNSSAKQFPKGTLLIALYGATVGKLGILTQDAATNQAVCAIFPPDDLETKYLFWYLRFVRSDLIAQAIGGAQPNISQGILRNLLIPFAPLYQQKQIVAEIEKQFSRLDEAVANLKRVKANLKRYKAAVLKAAVLKAAVEGKLTEDWRKQHPEVEPASKLLERILAERRTRRVGRGKYKEPDTVDASGLPLIPNIWKWVSLDQLLLNITDGDHQPPPQTDSGVPFLVIGNVRSGMLEFEDSRFVSRQYADGVDVFRKPIRGDILYTLVGSFGIALRVDTDQEFCIQRHIGVLRPHKLSPAAYLIHALNSLFIFLQATKVATGTAQKTVPLAGLRRFAIPLAPQAEQQQIVAEVERRLSVIEELESAVEANLTRADRLRQSTLAHAFSGMLVGAA